MPTSLVSTGVQFPDNTTQTTAAAASGLTLLQTITASGSPSSVDLETGIGSTYNFYLVTYTDVTPNTGSAFLRLQMKLDGTYRTSGYFVQGVGGYSSGSSALAYGAGNESGINLTLSSVVTTAGQGAHGEVWFSNPTSTTAYKMMNWAGGYLDGSNLVNLQGSSGQFTGGVGNTALTGVRFVFTSSRTFASGIFRLYGLANS